jgi:hypothetical protein
MAVMLGQMAPKVAVTARRNASSDVIDLSGAENELLHAELKAFLAQAISQANPKEVCSSAHIRNPH